MRVASFINQNSAAAAAARQHAGSSSSASNNSSKSRPVTVASSSTNTHTHTGTHTQTRVGETRRPRRRCVGVDNDSRSRLSTLVSRIGIGIVSDSALFVVLVAFAVDNRLIACSACSLLLRCQNAAADAGWLTAQRVDGLNNINRYSGMLSESSLTAAAVAKQQRWERERVERERNGNSLRTHPWEVCNVSLVRCVQCANRSHRYAYYRRTAPRITLDNQSNVHVVNRSIIFMIAVL